MEISPVTLYRIGTCCHMINRITFVNPIVYDKFARAAFNSLMCDLGNFANVSANTHSLFCHEIPLVSTNYKHYNITYLHYIQVLYNPNSQKG